MSRTLDSDGGGQRIDARRVTLADLLAALAVVGLVLAAVLAILEEGQRAYSHGAARVETQQTARVALARMAREIRQAGEHRPHRGPVDGTALLGTTRRPATPRHSADNQCHGSFYQNGAWVQRHGSRAKTPANRPRRSPRPGAAQAPSAVAGLGVCAGAPGGGWRPSRHLARRGERGQDRADRLGVLDRRDQPQPPAAARAR